MKRTLTEKIGKIPEYLLRLLFLFIFLTGIYLTADTLSVYQKVSPDCPEKSRPETMDGESLTRYAKDAVAWLTLDKTSVDHPVMQGIDNQEYLNKDPEGKDSIAGSIFLDCRCASDFSDPYVLLYGHHMAAGLMFGALDLFADEGYFMAHRTGSLFTGSQRYEIKTIAYLTVSAECEEIFSPEENRLSVSFIKEHAAIFDPAANNGHRMALTTCHASDPSLRTVLLVSLTKVPRQAAGDLS